MTKIVEKNLAEMIIIGLFLIVFLSSCASTSSCGNSNYHRTYTMCPAYH